MFTTFPKKKIKQLILVCILLGFSNSLLAQMLFEQVQTPIKSLKINDDSYVQRDLGDYVLAVAGRTNPDFIQDKDELFWKEYLNRPHPTRATLRSYFVEAAEEFGVPVDVLMAIAYVESNWTQLGPSMDRRWGVMRLGENHYCKTLKDAAKLLGVSKQELKDDAQLNIRGAAALLAKYAGTERKNFQSLNDWFEAVKMLSGHIDEATRETAAEEYYKILKNGVKSFSLWNEKYALEPHGQVNVAAKLVHKQKQEAETQKMLKEQSTSSLTFDMKQPNAGNDTGSANATQGYDNWYGKVDRKMNSPNQSSRKGKKIDVWVNHWFGVGTWAGALSWLNDKKSKASAHFLVRNDGYLVQIVPISRKSWHASVFNSRSIGVEHHATVDHPDYWQRTAMLKKSAEVARYYCDALGIPKVHKKKVYQPGIYGHTEIPTVSKNCPGPLPWKRWFGYLNGTDGGSDSPKTVETPTIYSAQVQNNGHIILKWKPNTDTNLAGFRIFYSTSDDVSNFKRLLSVSASSSSCTISSLTPNKNGYNFKIIAVNKDNETSNASDVYATYKPNSSDTQNVLIVDGFDRRAAYTSETHQFATTYMRAFRNADPNGVRVSSCANEAITDKQVRLTDYDLVLWFTGDESTKDETFSTAEQQLVKAYLEAGKKMIVTGSEIGWDLYKKGSTSDKSFFNNYLKASYVSDGGSGRSPSSGVSGTVFSSVAMNFGQVYKDKYPDDISQKNGSEKIMKYANKITCGVGYLGVFGSSQKSSGLVYVSFSVETVAYEPSIKAFIKRSLEYLNGVNQAPNAVFSANPKPAVEKEPVTFDASSSSDSDGTIVNYSWDFGDGKTGTGKKVQHTYQNKGEYTVRLTIRDNDGATSKAGAKIKVLAKFIPEITKIDDFEINMGHFDKPLHYSGTTTGINSEASSKARVTTSSNSGEGSLQMTISDDASSTSDILVRVLSGSGVPANNISLSSDLKIQLWLATSTANPNATIALWIDDNDGIEETKQLKIKNDGAYHLYEWNLPTATWKSITGNGALDASSITIDAIALRTPNASANWSLNIDDVQATTTSDNTSGRVEQIETQLDYEYNIDFVVDEFDDWVALTTNNEVKVYPTVVNDQVTIAISGKISNELNYYIYDTTGKLIQRDKLSQNLNQVPLKEVKKGMYFIKIIGQNINEGFKIIKN